MDCLVHFDCYLVLVLTMTHCLHRAHCLIRFRAIYHFPHESTGESPCSMSTAQAIARGYGLHALQSNPMQTPMNSNCQRRLRFLDTEIEFSFKTKTME